LLILEKLATIKADKFKQADVLRSIGKPCEIVYYDRGKLNGWNYAYNVRPACGISRRPFISTAAALLASWKTAWIHASTIADLVGKNT